VSPALFKILYNKIVLKTHDLKCTYLASHVVKNLNELTEGIRYSSTDMGVILFCLDDCCKDYLNVKKK
jgi:hypothetical protein